MRIEKALRVAAGARKKRKPRTGRLVERRPDCADREVKTWLLEDRLGRGHGREFRINRAWHCLLRINNATGESVTKATARLEFTDREYAALHENQAMAETFGLIDPTS